MKKETDNKDIIKTLQDMPDVVDKVSKEEFYNRISNEMNKVKQTPIHKKKRLPAIGLIGAIIIILLALPSFMKSSEFFSSQEKTFDNENYNNTKESSTNYENKENKLNNTEESLKSSNSIKDNKSHVAMLLEDETAIFVSLADKQIQYFIPITLVVDYTNDLSSYYNNIPNYLYENNWGVKEYLFNDTSFEINLEQNEVFLQVPDDFDIESSSAFAYSFEETLKRMFLPYNIDNVIFKTDDDEGIDLGSLGVIKELLLDNNVKPSYKVYQLSDKTKPLLVPIPYEDITNVSAAFNEMKVSEESFHVTQSIPDHVTYTLETDGKELLVYFDDEVVLEDEQEYVTMIDAMLFTAKEYDYEKIRFNNPTTNLIGPYDLSESILVPDIVNPVYISE